MGTQSFQDISAPAETFVACHWAAWLFPETAPTTDFYETATAWQTTSGLTCRTGSSLSVPGSSGTFTLVLRYTDLAELGAEGLPLAEALKLLGGV